MATAIRTVHQPNGPWVDRGGWEYPAVVSAIVETGPGPMSLDAALGQERTGDETPAAEAPAEAASTREHANA
jgi:putative oxidoreductase